MKNVVMAASAAVLAFSLAACSEPSPEDRMLSEMESFVDEVETLAERDSVCLSEMETIFTEGGERFMTLAAELELSEDAELTEEQEERLEAFETRMTSAGMELQQKADYSC